MRPFPSLKGWMLTKSKTKASETSRGSYVPLEIWVEYSEQIRSTAAGVPAALVGVNLATVLPPGRRSAMTLSESFHFPAKESSEKR